MGPVKGALASRLSNRDAYGREEFEWHEAGGLLLLLVVEPMVWPSRGRAPCSCGRQVEDLAASICRNRSPRGRRWTRSL